MTIRRPKLTYYYPALFRKRKKTIFADFFGVLYIQKMLPCQNPKIKNLIVPRDTICILQCEKDLVKMIKI